LHNDVIFTKTYEMGSSGLSRDSKLAAKYFKIASRHIRQADEALGIMYFHGLGTESGLPEPLEARVCLLYDAFI
jgi:TPR repeat protein